MEIASLRSQWAWPIQAIALTHGASLIVFPTLLDKGFAPDQPAREDSP
jgi:hypothetical protein